ncbi:AbiJ-related protein, partial [Streptomyces cinereoruber]
MTSSDLTPAHPQPSITAVTRYDIFNYLREISSPWWGKLDEVTFLEDLYDLDQPTADNSQLLTVRADIQQHRINNYDLDDDWIFEDSRLGLSDGLNRPGFFGGSDPWKGWSHASTEEVPRRAAGAG